MDDDVDRRDGDPTNGEERSATTEDEDDAAAISALLERQRRATHDKPSSQASHASGAADFKSTRKRARR